MKILFITLVSISLIVSLYNWGAYAYYVKESKAYIELRDYTNIHDNKTSDIEKTKSNTERVTKCELWDEFAGVWRFKSMIDLFVLIFAVFIFYKPLKLPSIMGVNKRSIEK